MRNKPHFLATVGRARMSVVTAGNRFCSARDRLFRSSSFAEMACHQGMSDLQSKLWRRHLINGCGSILCISYITVAFAVKYESLAKPVQRSVSRFFILLGHCDGCSGVPRMQPCQFLRKCPFEDSRRLCGAVLSRSRFQPVFAGFFPDPVNAPL